MRSLHRPISRKTVQLGLAAIAINPHSSEVRNNLGVDLILLGDSLGVLQQFREALRLNPNDYRARQNLQRFEGRAMR